VEGDKSDIHPPKFCNTCYATLRKMQAALDSGTEYRSSLEPFTWAQHSEMGCTSCQHFEVQMKGGRPKKRKSSSVCAHSNSCSVVEHINSVAGPRLRCTHPLYVERFFTPASSAVSLVDLQCPMCNCVVDQPVEVCVCRSIVCAECCLTLLRKGENLQCPSCNQQHEISVDTIQSPSPVAVKLVANLVVRCDDPTCSRPVVLQHLHDHLKSGCKEMAAEVSSVLTVEQMLEQPLDTPPTSLERQAAGHLVRRLHQSPGPEANTVTVPTLAKSPSRASVPRRPVTKPSVGVSRRSVNIVRLSAEVKG